MRLQVIGDPVLHSKSPVIQGAMIRALGLDIPYAAKTVARGDLPQYLQWAETFGITGFNATMPHKEDLLPLLDQLDPGADAAGAANTVCRRDNRWIGFNTDGAGSIEAMKEVQMDPQGRAVLVLGAGGAARAVVPALLQAGADNVTVCNRNLARAEALCERAGKGSTAAPFTPEELTRQAKRTELVVNCTNLGMGGTGQQFPDFSCLEALPQDTPIFDLIYHPAETELLSRGKALGHPVSNGLGMLVWQAVLALEHFLQRSLDRPAMAAAARSALGA